MTYTPSLHTPPTQQDKPQVSPARVLQKVISEQRSGRITITDAQDPSIRWRVYLGGGQLHFAESTMGHTERLAYVLKNTFQIFAYRNFCPVIPLSIHCCASIGKPRTYPSISSANCWPF